MRNDCCMTLSKSKYEVCGLTHINIWKIMICDWLLSLSTWTLSESWLTDSYVLVYMYYSWPLYLVGTMFKSGPNDQLYWQNCDFSWFHRANTWTVPQVKAIIASFCIYQMYYSLLILIDAIQSEILLEKLYIKK